MVDMDKYDYVRFTWPDLNGIAKGKIIPGRNASEFLESGIDTFCGVVSLGPRSDVVIQPEVEEGRYGNCRYVPILDTLYDVTWKSTKESCVGEIFCEPVWTDDGTFFPVGPRYIARKQLNILKKLGYTLLSACEYEARVDFNDTKQPLFNGRDVYSQREMAKYSDLFFAIDQQMSKAGVNIRAFHTEWGKGQIEWSLQPYWGIDMADKSFIFKEAVKEICDDKGFELWFTPISFLDATANGCHYNHSIWDEAKNNVFLNKSDPQRFSDVGRYWLGGLIQHGRALSALCSPTVNCYRRYHRPWAPDKVNWGYDDRQASLRARTESLGPQSKGPYIENRLGSPCSNPYLLLAGTVAAGIDGIKNKIEPPPPGQYDVSENVPFSLAEALDALEADTALCAALGDQFIRWFLKCKRDSDLVILAGSHPTIDDEEQISREREYYKHC